VRAFQREGKPSGCGQSFPARPAADQSRAPDGRHGNRRSLGGVIQFAVHAHFRRELVSYVLVTYEAQIRLLLLDGLVAKRTVRFEVGVAAVMIDHDSRYAFCAQVPKAKDRPSTGPDKIPKPEQKKDYYNGA
jgi:hypothetical protein